MEFLCEYDFEVKYIQGNENVVANCLSHKRHKVSALTLGVELRSHILQTLPADVWYQEVSREINLGRALEGRFLGYSLESDGLLCHTRRIYVPLLDELHNLILFEAHCAPYLAHLGVKKMHVDLRQFYY